jgi:hypothetical protein
LGLDLRILIGIFPIGKIPIRIWDKIPIGIFPIGIHIGNFRKGRAMVNTPDASWNNKNIKPLLQNDLKVKE